MSQTEFKPHKISKVIQLPGFWLTAVVITSGSFLWIGINIDEPPWVTPLLVIAAVCLILFGFIAFFLLMTKYRPNL